MTAAVRPPVAGVDVSRTLHVEMRRAGEAMELELTQTVCLPGEEEPRLSLCLTRDTDVQAERAHLDLSATEVALLFAAVERARVAAEAHGFIPALPAEADR